MPSTQASTPSSPTSRSGSEVNEDVVNPLHSFIFRLEDMHKYSQLGSPFEGHFFGVAIQRSMDRHKFDAQSYHYESRKPVGRSSNVNSDTASLKSPD